MEMRDQHGIETAGQIDVHLVHTTEMCKSRTQEGVRQHSHAVHLHANGGVADVHDPGGFSGHGQFIVVPKLVSAPERCTVVQASHRRPPHRLTDEF
jgi:hypothetical protein